MSCRSSRCDRIIFVRLQGKSQVITDESKGVFTPEVSIDASFGAWKEYIGFNSTAPSVSVSVNTGTKIQMVSRPIQKRQR